MPDTPSHQQDTPQVPATPSRRERRKIEVRSRIYGVARDLFTKQGFETTTVDEIARVADVAPATFFNHFQSKQALLGLMTGEVFEYLHAMTSEHLEREGSADEKLRAFISSATEGIAASRGVARDVLLEFMRIDATPNGPHPYLERLFEPFVTLIEEGQTAGVMRDDHDATFLAQMAVGMMNSAITNWLADPEYAVEAGLIEAAEFALATLAPRSTPVSANAKASESNQSHPNRQDQRKTNDGN
ncbi:MAG TPA: TetR/AcrR family transcriptional regulator [Myxococcales bacterium]|nr:TetR/AcrR family transcriptional regulator [Myxococcales bacterium]HIK85376.1 TetR/AcrR family transcriptional regulator [Myxococcales bacterium]